MSDERGVHNTLVKLDHLVYACQRTIFYDPNFAGMPTNKLFDLEADVANGDPWIIDRKPTEGPKPTNITASVNKEIRKRARKKRKGKS